MGEQTSEFQPDDLIVVRAGDRSDTVLVLGGSSLAERLGEPLAPAAPEMVRRFVDAAGLAGAGLGGSELMSGRWVRLAAETVATLEQHGAFMRDGTGVELGLVRGAAGRIEHVARFGTPVLNPVAAGILLSTMGVQQKLRRIEAAVREVAERVDVLVEGSHIEAEARLAAALDTIRRIERRVRDRGLVDDRDWASMAAIEPTVKEVYHQTVRWLDPLRAALDASTLNLSQQLRLLRGNLGVRDIDFWLRMYAYSELVLKRWELLYLLHEADAAPERLRTEAAFIEDRAQQRLAELMELYDVLAGYLDEPDRLSALERMRVISRVRLVRLRIELGHVANAYAEALGEARRDLPEYTPDGTGRSEVERRGPIIDVDELRAQAGQVAGDALTAGAESARQAVDATVNVAKKAGSWVRGQWRSGSDRQPPGET